MASTTNSSVDILPSPHSIILYIATSTLLPLLLHLYRKYLAFKALGPGGTPQTVFGFLKVFALSFVTVSNPYEIPDHYRNFPQEPGHLRSLPNRTGPRPETRGIAPHRQVTLRGDAATYQALSEAMKYLCIPGVRLSRGPSYFDSHSPALFAVASKKSRDMESAIDGRLVICVQTKQEICHIHPSDGGSMHLELCPADAKVVLEAGWGKRHPLARGGWFERFVPEGFVLVYAPRDEVEVEMVMRIVHAAIARTRKQREVVCVPYDKATRAVLNK